MKNRKSVRHTYLAGVAMILMACFSGGCTLAVPDAGTEGQGDQLIGAFITSEYLDLYDMEGYLNDHASSLMRNDSITIGSDERYEGKLMATVDKGEGKPSSEWKISFGNIKGEYMLMPVTRDADGNTSVGNLCSESICDSYLNYNVTDEGEEQEVKGKVYQIPSETEQIYYVNPVYQKENGEIYAMSGNGYSNGSETTEGDTIAATLSGEAVFTENGKSQKKTSTVTIQFASMYKPVRTILYQMNDANQVLKQVAYKPSAIPDTLKVEPGTAYIIEETHKEKPDGKIITARTLLNLQQDGEENVYLETWYPLSNGLISKKEVEIQ
ncbi:hypothetical protein ACTQWG_16480 [Blautia sp. HCP3S3_H10_1]|uniref:hypothetical protein n=1 Tax=unclassified Blautia TaxID=2648079 RepID=UPI003F8DEFE8|nr:hypothetical protein [Clostridia bacterium]